MFTSFNRGKIQSISKNFTNEYRPSRFFYSTLTYWSTFTLFHCPLPTFTDLTKLQESSENTPFMEMNTGPSSHMTALNTLFGLIFGEFILISSFLEPVFGSY